MKDVTIYTTTYCPYCTRAKKLLARKGVAFNEIDVTGDDAMRAKLVEMSDGMKTVPQIFIGGAHVGGFGDLAELEEEGKLDAMLADSQS
ncbi:MAG: glutaredoxin 3 [Deltaproteobacteria bacterium]|nr:glutaredoxin 3 [Deltaproteobacteria bacterium]